MTSSSLSSQLPSSSWLRLATAFFLIAFVRVIFINLCFIGIDAVWRPVLRVSPANTGLTTTVFMRSSLGGGGRRRWCCFCLHARPDLSRRNFFGTRAELAGRVPFLGFITQRDNIPLPPPLSLPFFLFSAHREQGNALAGDVHVEHGDEHFLMHFDDFVGIAHEAVRQLADVDEPVLDARRCPQTRRTL